MFTAPCLVALAAVSPTIGQRPIRMDELRPSLGLFAGAADPYELALSRKLVENRGARECQMVVVPSFSAEWCVGMWREEGTPPELHFLRMKRSLWGEMNDVLSAHDTKSQFYVTDETETEALNRASAQVERFMAIIDPETAGLLERAWWGMLGRVRYPDSEGLGLDGTTYHFAHWGVGSIRAGDVWSPDEGSRTRALVSLGEHMRDLILAPPQVRFRLEREIRIEAQSLLDRIEQANQASSPR